ncbi:unnamed protein product, partial [Effrenium voratum]
NYFIVGLQTESAEEAAVTMSRRQRRRAYAVRYWDNVLRNALALADRKRKRRERAEEEIFAFYADMVKDEMAETSGADLQKGKECADAVFQITEKPSTSEQAKEDVRGCAEKQVECFLWDLRVVLERRKFAMQYENCVTPKCSAGSGTEDAAPGGIRIPLSSRASSWTQANLQHQPEDFYNLTLPNAQFDLLRLQNTHTRDGRLRFESESHTYYINGVKTLGSVTGLVHKFEEPFVSDEAIRKMMAGPRWPREPYIKKPCSTPMTPEEIKDMWARNAKLAANQGTWTHLQCECVLNGGAVADGAGSMEMQLFRTFLLGSPKLIAYRTEWAIFGGRERLAGTIDFVARNDRGELVLYDWKRTKQLRHKYANVFNSMTGFLSHVLRVWILSLLLDADDDNPLDTYASASSFNARLSETLMLFELLENGHFKSFALVCYTLYHNELVQEDWLQHYLDAAQEFPRWQDQAVRCLMLVHLLRLPQRPTRLEHLCASNALPPIAEETAEPDDVLGGGLNDSQNTQDTFRQELSQEMQSRLEGVEASPISVKRERLDPQGAAASSSQHAGAPHETKKEEPEEDDDGAPAEPEISVDTATWSVLQKRRLLPGAARSAFDFADHFNTLSNQNTQFQTQAAEPIDKSHTVLEQTKRFTVFVRERLHGVPDTIVRLCVAALAVFR